MGTKAETKLKQVKASVSGNTVQQTSSPRKPGPVPGMPTRKYNVLIEETLGEWAKGEPGGLSEMVRRLLKAEWERQGKTTDHENA